MTAWLSLAVEVAAIVLGAGILGIVGWLVGSIRDISSRQLKASIAIDRRLDHIEKNIVKIEDLDRHDIIDRVGNVELEQAADRARSLKAGDLTRVHERVDVLAREVHSMTGTIGALDESVGRIHDYLLQQGGK